MVVWKRKDRTRCYWKKRESYFTRICLNYWRYRRINSRISRGSKGTFRKKKLKIICKDFPLNQLFDIERGVSKYTKRYGNLHKGKYPVFSASNNAPLTHIDSFDFDGDYLTWATNGFAGYIKNISGRFSINADRGLLKPKIENLNIKYIKYKLEPVLNLEILQRGVRAKKEKTNLQKCIRQC